MGKHFLRQDVFRPVSPEPELVFIRNLRNGIHETQNDLQVVFLPLL